MKLSMLIGLAFTWALAQAQNSSLLCSIDVEASQVHIDQLNHLYLQRETELLKYDPKCQLQARYSAKTLGPNLQIDVSNPLKILVFSPDQMRIVFLDSRLGELNDRVDLLELGFAQTSLVASSHSNGFWIYDPVRFTLVRFGAALQRESATLNLAQLLRLELSPTHLVEANNRLLLCDPMHGIFVFDAVGNYLKRLPMKAERLSVIENKIGYCIGGHFFEYDLDTEIESPLGITATEIKAPATIGVNSVVEARTNGVVVTSRQ